MENKNQVKEKVKKVLWKMFRLQTMVFIVLISLALSSYAYQFYRDKQLVFGVNDSKILFCLTIMFCWVMLFCIYLMIELNKKDKIIITQNEIIMKKNDTIENLLHQVIQQGTSIEEKADNLQEAIDYGIERSEEQYSQLIHSNRNTQEIILDRR